MKLGGNGVEFFGPALSLDQLLTEFFNVIFHATAWHTSNVSTGNGWVCIGKSL
jgi:hypothetical protein